MDVLLFVVCFFLAAWLLPKVPEPWRSYLANEEPPK